METLRKELTPEERQANVDALIHRLVTRKRQALKEMQHEYDTNPRIKEIINDLKNRNGARK